ncbi:MAG TPA: glycosyltransferase family 4 protein [Actinomycetota bacterium]
MPKSPETARARRLNLAYVSRSAPPRAGGIEAHMRRVAAGLVAGGHRIRVFAARIDDEPFTRLNTTLAAQRFEPFLDGEIEVWPIPSGRRARAAMLPSAVVALPGADRIGYDRIRRATLPLIVTALAPGFKRAFFAAKLVHCWGGEPLMHAAARAARQRLLPLVVTPFAHPGHWGDDDLNAGLYRNADAVVALLPGEAAFYASLGVAEPRLHVIPVAAPAAVDGGADPRAVHGIDTPIVLALGVKRPYKYRALLQALPRIANKNVRFVFVGPETAESEADFAAAADSRILRRGKVDEAEKWGWLRAANVLCLPSVSEILPVSILEAWRTGTPVVVAEGRFTRDLVADGEDGIVCTGEPEQIARAIESVLLDPAAAERMGRAGAAKVAQRYEPETVVAQHETLYASLA